MNRKPNSHNASGIRRKGLLRIAFCCGFMATAMLTGCVKEVLEPQPNKDGIVSLQIKAAISDGIETRAPILETNFPVSDVGTVSNIGLYMMQSDGTTPYATGSDNLTAELTGKTGPVYTCRYQYRGGEWMEILSFYINETIKLWGYYPHNEGATATAIPFDLTAASEQTDQTDILWCPPQTVTATSADFTQSVSLSFKHAYALLEFQVKKKVADPGKPAIFTRTDVMNKSGKNWIANKGSINPQTGAFSATAGTVSINCSATLATDSYTPIRVMVPAFSGAYADDDIEVQFTGNDLVIQKFTIKKSYLSEQSGSFGFTAGKKYSFKLLYNNFGEGSLTLLPWNEDGDSGNVGDDSSHGTVDISPWTTKDNNLDIGEVP